MRVTVRQKFEIRFPSLDFLEQVCVFGFSILNLPKVIRYFEPTGRKTVVASDRFFDSF